jgi:hypothetical protein
MDRINNTISDYSCYLLPKETIMQNSDNDDSSDLRDIIERAIRKRLNQIINDLDFVTKELNENQRIRPTFKKELDILKIYGFELKSS